jgi:hypothetical protein
MSDNFDATRQIVEAQKRTLAYPSLWNSGTGTTEFWGFVTERSDTFHRGAEALHAESVCAQSNNQLTLYGRHSGPGLASTVADGDQV